MSHPGKILLRLSIPLEDGTSADILIWSIPEGMQAREALKRATVNAPAEVMTAIKNLQSLLRDITGNNAALKSFEPGIQAKWKACKRRRQHGKRTPASGRNKSANR